MSGRDEQAAADDATAPPKPGVTRVNSLFTVIAVMPGVLDDRWYVAAEQGDGKHWATWLAVDTDGLLNYEAGALFGSRDAALRDLSERTGVSP
jgi:hypothetical protein